MNDLGIINFYKPKGWTPLQAVDAVKQKFPELKDVSVTYAGRLDPLAEGVLLLLSGDKISEKEKFLGLSKTYIARILFGFQTDTFDVLGIATEFFEKKLSTEEIQKTLQFFRGTLSLPLPAYSSPPVSGKPLFQWARENKLDEIEIPKRDMEVHDISLIKFGEIPWEDVYTEISQSIGLVSGDFRQGEILKRWEELKAAPSVQIAEVQISCSSGTYIRSIANKLGSELGTKACLLSLQRTAVGDFLISESIKV